MNYFDQVRSRAGSHSEKYDARMQIFGDEKVTPLWVADMDLPAPAFLPKELAKRVEHPLYGYTQNYDEIFDSICWWHETVHSLTLAPDSIGLSPSVVTTIANAIDAFTEPGEGVALFGPVYGPFGFQIKKQKREAVRVSLQLIDGRYQIDWMETVQAFTANPPKLLLLCSPQNPSGRLWSRDELQQLVSLCKKSGTVILSDEIHSDLVYKPNSFSSILSLEGAEECCIVAHSIGKSFNCSGLNASYWIAPNKSLFRKMARQCDAAHTNAVNLFGKAAICALYSVEGTVYRSQLLDYLAENLAIVERHLTPLAPYVKVIRPDAGFLAWLDFRQTGTTHAAINEFLVEKAGLGLSGGEFFGPEGEQFFRLNFAVPRVLLEDALRRLVAAFDA